MAPRFMKALSTRGKRNKKTNNDNVSSKHVSSSSVAIVGTSDSPQKIKKSPEFDACMNTISTTTLPTMDDSRCCDEEVEVLTTTTSATSSPSASSSKSISSASSSPRNQPSPNTLHSLTDENEDTETGNMSDQENEETLSPTSTQKKANYYDEVLPDLLPKETLQVGHIAKAAHALDTAGDECFEQGNYELAMTSYTRALNLKRRALHTLKEDPPNRPRPTSPSNSENNKETRTACTKSMDKNDGGSPVPPVPTPTTPAAASKRNLLSSMKSKSKRSLSVIFSKSSKEHQQHEKDHQETQPSQDAPATTPEAKNKNAKSPSKTPKVGGEKAAEEVVLASVATSMNNIGYLRQRSGGSSEEIMAAYRNALTIKKQILGPQNLSVGKTLNNIGSVYFSKQDFEKAMEAYKEALGIFYRHLGREHLDVATVHSNIGDVYLAQGDNAQALIKYREALNIRWSQLGRRDRRVERLLEKVAALEMDRMIENLEEEDAAQNHPTHLSPEDLEYHSDDDIPGVYPPPMTDSFQVLREEVKNDMEYIENIKRQVVVDMVKEKLQILREMKALTDGDDSTSKKNTISTETDEAAPAEIRIQITRTMSDPTNDRSPQDEDSGLKEPKMTIPAPLTPDKKVGMRSHSVNMMSSSTTTPANTPPRSSITPSSTISSPASTICSTPSTTSSSAPTTPTRRHSYNKSLSDVKDRLARIRSRRAIEHANLTQGIQQLQVLAVGHHA